MDLVEFLLARIAEDEAVAREATEDARREPVSLRPVEGQSTAGALSVMENVARWHPARVLAECEAKRRIVEAWRQADESAGAYPGTDAGAEMGLAEAAALLALPYADHPDYREEWRP